MKVIADLIKANVELNRLDSETKAKDEQIANLQAEIETLKEAHQKESDDLKATHQTALDEANGKINLLTEANELLEEQKTSAAEQAADIVAKQGVEAPVEENTNTQANTEDKSLDELWKEYNAISDQDDRRAFYLEHIKPLRK